MLNSSKLFKVYITINTVIVSHHQKLIKITSNGTRRKLTSNSLFSYYTVRQLTEHSSNIKSLSASVCDICDSTDFHNIKKEK